MIIRILEKIGLDRAPWIERQLDQILGNKGDSILKTTVLNGRIGRCVVLLYRSKKQLFVSWRGRLDGDEFASLILSNLL